MTANVASTAGPSDVLRTSPRLLRNVPARSITIDLHGTQNLPTTPHEFRLYLHNLVTKHLDWHEQWATQFIAVLKAHLDSDRVKEYRATKAPQLTDDVMVLAVAAYTADLKDYKVVFVDPEAVANRGRNIYHALNEAMRHDTDIQAFAPLIHHLKGALRLMDHNLQPLTLYRGVNFEDCTLQYASCGDPSTFYLPGFTSTSVEMAQALKFSNTGGTLVEIEVPAGYVTDISTLSVLPHECEYLLLPDTPVHIAAEVGIVTNRNDVLHARLRITDDPRVRQYFAPTPASSVAALSSARHMIRRYGVEHQVHKTIDSFGSSRGGLTWIHGVGGSGKTVAASQVTTARAARHVVGPIAVAGSNMAMLKRTLASALSGNFIDPHTDSLDADRSTRTKRINAASLDEVVAIFVSAVNTCPRHSALAPPLILMDDVPYNDSQVHDALARLATACTVVATSRVPPPDCLSVIAKPLTLPSLSHHELYRLHHEVSAVVVPYQPPRERHDPLATDWEQLLHASNDRVFVITRLLFRWLEVAPGSSFTGFMASTGRTKHQNDRSVAPDDNFDSSVGDLLEYELELAHARQPVAAMMLRYVDALQLSTFHGDVLVGSLGDGAEDGLRWLVDRQLIASAVGSPGVFTVHPLVLNNLRWSCHDASSRPRDTTCCWPGESNLVRMLARGAFPTGDRAAQPSHRIECHTCWIQAIHRQTEREREVRCLTEAAVDLCLRSTESATGSGMKTLERDIYDRLFFTTVAALTIPTVVPKKLCYVALAALDVASDNCERHHCEQILREALDDMRTDMSVDCLDLAASLNNVGVSLEAMGQREEGVALKHEALDMYRRLHSGIDHPHLAGSLNNVGSSLEAMGQREEGVALKREALDMYRRLHGGIGHPDVAMSLNNVGSSLEAMGRREEGAALQREALEMYRRLYGGIDHPELAGSLNAVGTSLEAMGRREEGVALQREALDMYRRLYDGVDHPDLATSLDSAGSSLEAMGQREEGVALKLQAFEMRRRLYDGVDHPDLARSLNNVGNSLEAMGELEEGVALQREALDMYRRLHGGIDHPDLAASLNNVGSSLKAMGELEEGVALMRKSLQMRRRLYGGVDHPDLAASLNNVGCSLETMGQREEGVALQREALGMYRRLHGGSDHSDAAASLDNVGNSLAAMGRSEEGVALQREALEMRRRLYGGIDHPDLAASLHNVGMSLEAMGQSEEGVALKREALEIMRRMHGGTDHPDLARSLSSVAASLEAMGERVEGAALQCEALEMRRRLYGSTDHPDVALSLNNVGISLGAMGQREEGVALMREALEMRRRLYRGIDHSHLASSLSNVGNSLEAIGQSEEGMALKREALEVYRRLHGGTDHSKLALSLDSVGSSLAAMGRREEGVALQREALEMRRRLYGSTDHPDAAASLTHVGSSLTAMGQREEGVALQREALEMYRRLCGGIDLLDLAGSLNNEGTSLEAMGQLEEGVGLKRVALDMYRRLYGGIDHPDLAGSLNNVGMSLEAMGQREEGVALQREALEMSRRLCGGIDHPDAAGSLNNMGSWLEAMGQREEGVTLIREALEMYHRLYDTCLEA
jgi:tetratricopeptide (TPR) repeat protein